MAGPRNGQQRTTKSSQSEERRQKPTWSRRVGGIEVAFWKGTTGEGENARETCSLKVKKTFLDGEEYREASSFFPHEVPVLAALLQDAFSAMGYQE